MQTRNLTFEEDYSLLMVKQGVKEMSRSELENAVADLWETVLRLQAIQTHSQLNLVS